MSWCRRLLCCVFLLGISPVGADGPALLLAESWQGNEALAAYWVSEKLDGVRAFWDGRRLRFRSGREVAAPDWFLKGLPPRPLDGELWLGRGRFDALSALVRREIPDDREWRQVRYMIFELPDGEGSFSQRIEQIQSLVAHARVPWLLAVPQFRLADQAALIQRLDEVRRDGGEGLMLHLADAPYVTGRSSFLLKVKPWLDAEARVVAHLPGKGRYAGMLGALLLELPDGRRFKLGSGFTQAQRRQPPPLGSSVTYRYRELTPAGLPRFATYWRQREIF